MDIALKVSHLAVEFATPQGVVNAVSDVSFDLARGEILGIVGESGCGKSVSCRAIMGLVSEPGRVTRGSVLFDGEDLLTLPEARMRHVRGRKIAMIFQDPLTFLNPVMKIGRQLMEPLMEHLSLTPRQSRARAIELLGMVGIPKPEECVDAYPHQFSGGMCQRVMIAMALSCNPDVLIADEPTTALDVTVQIQIVELIRRLQRENNMSVIWITHDLGVVAGLCDSVSILYAGHVVESAPIDALYETPRHPYTKALFASIPRLDTPLDAQMRSIPGVPPKLYALPPGCPFAPRCEKVFGPCAESMPEMADYGNGCFAACHAAKREGA